MLVEIEEMKAVHAARAEAVRERAAVAHGVGKVMLQKQVEERLIAQAASREYRGQQDVAWVKDIHAKGEGSVGQFDRLLDRVIDDLRRNVLRRRPTSAEEIKTAVVAWLAVHKMTGLRRLNDILPALDAAVMRTLTPSALDARALKEGLRDKGVVPNRVVLGRPGTPPPLVDPAARALPDWLVEPGVTRATLTETEDGTSTARRHDELRLSQAQTAAKAALAAPPMAKVDWAGVYGKQRQAATLMLQSHYRGWACRRDFVKKRAGAMRIQAHQRRVVGYKRYVEKRTKAEARARYRSQMKQDRLQALAALPFHMLDDVPEVGKSISDKQFLKAGGDVDLDEYFDWDHLKNNAEISPPPPVGRVGSVAAGTNGNSVWAWKPGDLGANAGKRGQPPAHADAAAANPVIPTPPRTPKPKGLAQFMERAAPVSLRMSELEAALARSQMTGPALTPSERRAMIEVPPTPLSPTEVRVSGGASASIAIAAC